MNSFDTIKHLTTHYAEILTPRGVSFLGLLRGRSDAGRVVRLAQAAVAERSDYHAKGEPEDWKQDSTILYAALTAKAEQIGALSKERCEYWRHQLQQESAAYGRFRMLFQMHAKNQQHTQVLCLDKVENIQVLQDALAQRRENSEPQRLIA